MVLELKLKRGFNIIKVKAFKGIGRGLVSSKPIKKGTVFHTAEIIQLSPKDAKIVSKTLLGSYVYDLGSGSIGIALGFGSLFNHAEKNNVDFEVVVSSKGFRRVVIRYKANRNIKAGEQLFINYGYGPV